MAALYAMGFSPYYIYILCKNHAKSIIGTNTRPIISGIRSFIKNGKTSIKGLKNGEEIEKLFDIVAKRRNINKISDIKMPIVIPTVDLMDSKEYVFTNNIPENEKNKKQYITDCSIGKAVRASSSFPAVFEPCKDKKHAFLDGGIIDNIPAHEVKKQGADKVISVKFNSDKIDENSNVMNIVMKTIDIMGSKISEESLELSDLVLNVYTDKTGLLDIKKLDNCYKYGYKCVMDNIEKIKEILKE